MYGFRRGGGSGGPDPPPPPEKSQNLGLVSNSGPDLLKNHKATEPAFNVGPSSSSQGDAIEMVFRWRADDDPLIVVFGSSHPSSTKNNRQSWTPSDKIYGSVHVL